MLRMKRRKRIHYTDPQKALMRDHWQQGDPLHQIAFLFDRHRCSVRNMLAEHGGIRPSMRRRSPRMLSLAERGSAPADSKGIDLADVQEARLDAVARRLNERPRQTLGYKMSAE